MVMAVQKPGEDAKGKKWVTFTCPDCGLTTVQRDIASVICPRRAFHRNNGSVRMVK